MKILQLISSSGCYGAEKMVLGLSRELLSAGHEVLVANIAGKNNSGDDIVACAEKEKIPAERILCRGRFDKQGLEALIERTKKNAVDVLHCHGYKSDFYAAVMRMVSSVITVATCHNWPQESMKMRFYKRLDLKVLGRFNGVAAVSGEIKREMLQRGIKGVELIHNGIDVENYGRGTIPRDVLKQRYGFKAGDKVVGSIGRIAPEKGYACLIEAAAAIASAVPSARILIAGDGPDREPLQKAVRAKGLDGIVRFLGRREDIADVLDSMDVFVLPSFKEGMPMALLEAMAAAKAVVATAVGEVPSVIENGVSGVIIGSGDPKAIADAVTKLLKDPAEAGVLSRNAFNAVRTRYGSGLMAKKYMDMYERVNAC